MTGHHHADDHIGDHTGDHADKQADDQPDRDELDGLAAEHDYEDFDSGWSPELEARLTDVCWAVAARDCALEVGDRSAAAGFAEQARDAIAQAVAAGIAPAELADELGYPGGHTAMDGPHIDDEIAALRPPAEPDPPTRAARPTAVSAAVVSAAAGLAAAAAVTADGEAGDAAGEDQLTRWHHDDRAAHSAEDHGAEDHGAEDHSAPLSDHGGGIRHEHDEHDGWWT
jgi:hypothetical protein